MADVGHGGSDLSALIEWCGSTNSSQLLVEHGGDVTVEESWHGATPSTTIDIASIQKCLSAVVLGQLVHEGVLSLDDPVADHLGVGWTAAPDAAAERRITIRHLASMTSGLNGLFEVEAAPGTEWYYCNNGYHQVRKVMERSTGLDCAALFAGRLFEPLGMTSTEWRPRPEMVDPTGWVISGIHSTARDLARFGRAVLDRRDLGCTDAFVDEMLSASSDLNPSYGLLWWLFDGERAIVPGYRKDMTFDPKRMFGGIALDHRIAPSAPAGLVAGMGAGDQRVYLVPSSDLVVVRLGRPAAEMSAAGGSFDEAFWSRFS